MTLPAFNLHQTLNRLTIGDETLLPKSSPHHSIAKVRLGIDQMLDTLRQNVVDYDSTIARPIVE